MIDARCMRLSERTARNRGAVTYASKDRSQTLPLGNFVQFPCSFLAILRDLMGSLLLGDSISDIND